MREEVILHKQWDDGDIMDDSGLYFGTLQSLEFIKNKVINKINNGSFIQQ